MHPGGRHPDVVEHAELEEKGDFASPQALDPPALGGHHADPLAVGHVVHADQVERIGQGMDHLAKIHIERHSGTSRAGEAWERRPHIRRSGLRRVDWVTSAAGAYLRDSNALAHEVPGAATARAWCVL